jgi:hypothetical protein
MPSSVRLVEVLGNLVICVFLDEGDVDSFIPGNCIMQVVDGREIWPEQRWRVVLSNKHQTFFVQTLLDVFVALQSFQNDVDLGAEAARTDCLRYEVLLCKFFNIFGLIFVVNKCAMTTRAKFLTWHLTEVEF